MAMIASVESENIEDVDGEVSIVFWSFAFVLLLIVTVWFYITQIAPMRRSVGQIEEIDKEEELAKRILEDLSDDLRFKNDNLRDKSSKKASPIRHVKEEDSSVYEYIDDEIHIHYSQYAWDNEKSDGLDFNVAAGTARRHSMENMDLIFPGLLPSIVEEEEYGEESDTESSEKSHDTDVDVIQDDTGFFNVPTVCKPIVNNNGGSIESSVNKRYDYSDKGANSQESQLKDSDTKQDRVIIREPAESFDSRYMLENLNNALNIKSLPEDTKPEQNDTSLLSRQIDNRPQVVDTENCQSSSSDKRGHSEKQESVIPVKCEIITECTSGSFDMSSDKYHKLSTEENIPIKSNDADIERSSMFTLSNCDLEPSLKQDANEYEDKVVKLCVSNTQKISCPTENGLDQHSASDSCSKYATDMEHGRHINIEKELFAEKSDAPTESTRRLTGIDGETNKYQAAEFQLNGFGDDIEDYEHTTHAWTFFSMSGSDEITPEKKILNEKHPLDQEDVPTIIIESYEEGLQSDNSIANEDSAMNGHGINTSPYGEFETDIDIDDIDLIDSDELENEGEFSIYFKRHVSVTDLDKILSEEGQQNDANFDSSNVLETDFSMEQPSSEGTDVDMSKPSSEITKDAESKTSIQIAIDPTYIEDEPDMNIQKSVVVNTRLSDCLDNHPSDEQFDEPDSPTDNSPPKNYTVESLFDDVSFQKDGVYGELVLSKLNENYNNEPDESSFDSYGEDWYGFSEEFRRERKPFLFTIPEDEEIGVSEFEHYFRVPRNNLYVYDNEISATESAGQEQLLKAPIAAMETYDSDFDLDENEDTNGSETEDNGETPNIEQHEGNMTTNNGVTEETLPAKDEKYEDNITVKNGVTEETLPAKDETEYEDNITVKNGVTEETLQAIKKDEKYEDNTTMKNGVTEETLQAKDEKFEDNTTMKNGVTEETLQAKVEKCDGQTTDKEQPKSHEIDIPDNMTMKNGVTEETLQAKDEKYEDNTTMKNGVTEETLQAKNEKYEDKTTMKNDVTEETLQAKVEKYDEQTTNKEQPKSHEINIPDNMTMKNGVTEGADTAKDENKILEKTPTENGVTVKSAQVGDASIVAEHTTKSVKIVKKIKIFVRKEVNITTDDDDLIQDFIVKPKQLIQDPDPIAQDVTDPSSALKEVQEEAIFPACRECKTHHSYEVATAEVGDNYHFMEPLNYVDEKNDTFEANAEIMKVTTKKEKFVSVKAEPKSVSNPIKNRVSRLEGNGPADVISQDVVHLPTQNDKEKTNTAVEPNIELDVIIPNLSAIQANAPESVVQDDQAKINAELESTVESCDPSVEVKNDAYGAFKGDGRVPSVEVGVQESDNTRDFTKHTIQAGQRKLEAREVADTAKSRIPSEKDRLLQANVKVNGQPESVEEAGAQETKNMPDVNIGLKSESRAVKTGLSKRDATKRLPQVPAQSDKMEVKGGLESNITRKTITARASPVEVHARERNSRQPFTKVPTKEANATVNVVPRRKVETKTRVSRVKADASETNKTRDAAEVPSQDKKTKIDTVKEEIIKTESKLNIQAEPNTSNAKATNSVTAKAKRKVDVKMETEHGIGHTPTIKPAKESPTGPVKIKVQGRDSQDGRGKRARKTYLSSFNIRLTKSHEDLRFAERAPERLQESIEEEEAADVQSPQSDRSETPTTPEDVFESIEPPSIHTAKITVQEVIGDKQRIVILNVQKKVHGKARWKSLNDLDSINMALTLPRRSSDLGTGLASFAEEEETMEDKDNKDGKKVFTPTVVPIVELKSRHDRKSVPEMESVIQPRKSSIVKVTALPGQESVTENDAENKITATASATQDGQPEQASSSHTLPTIKATAREYLTEKERTTEVIKARVTPTLQEIPLLNEKPASEVTKTTKQEFKARVSSIESTGTLIEDGIEEKPSKRVTRVHDISQVVEVIPRLERETITEIQNESTKGNKIKVHVSQRIPPQQMEQKVLPPQQMERKGTPPQRVDRLDSSPAPGKIIMTDRETVAEISPTQEVRQRQGRESGYGSLGVSPDFAHVSSSSLVNRVFTLEGANERSVSSLSSIEDEEEGETLGESRVMVTDLDALLAQQVVPQTGEMTSKSPETEKLEVKEKVRVLARMEPVPEKVVRISKDEDEDNMIMRHVKHEEPIVVEPIFIADAAEQEESRVISALLLNDGYDDDELDEVFVEEYMPYDGHDNADDSYRTHSSDADSETSSVSSLPLKNKHRHTRGSLEASSPGVRNRTESSGSSKTATPVAELENEIVPTSSRSSTPESKAHEISREESFTYKTSEQSRTTDIKRTIEYTSAFTSVSRMTDARRPRARSHGNKSDEEPSVQHKGLGASFQDVKTLAELQIDRKRFKEAADSRKSMPDLSARKDEPLNDSPYLRGLSAHTRRWLSQNVWMDENGKQDEEDLMTSDLFLYPSNRFEPGSNIDASFLSLANERDFPDDVSVSTLSTRPQSPMSEFSFAGETPYWGVRRGSTTVIKCSNPRCDREEILFGGEKTSYTSCPACFTYYCTRACRRIHWSEHKKVCFFGRINSYIRSFIYLCHKKEALKFQLSKTAKDGHKKKGRGSVMVTFASAQSARKFMTTGCTFFPSPPTYSSLVDLQAEGVISKHKVSLMQHIKDYEPDEEFVLNLAIIAGKMENLPTNPVPRRKVSTVLQVVKIPLSNKLKETSPKLSLPSDPNTETKVFYLPKCARHEFVNENEARRHYCRNISKNLKQYGIRLKHDYPDVYEKLCRYVDQNIRFTEPLTVYGNQGKKIVMCKIMPETGDEENKAWS